tara:strand:+ start:1650 stop:1826 length:177 start_codon:yes stop_codon:yes gene_type:complete
MAKYKIRTHTRLDFEDNPITYEDILDQENNCSIPKDESNRQYQEYLTWVDEGEGNTPD